MRVITISLFKLLELIGRSALAATATSVWCTESRGGVPPSDVPGPASTWQRQAGGTGLGSGGASTGRTPGIAGGKSAAPPLQLPLGVKRKFLDLTRGVGERAIGLCGE